MISVCPQPFLGSILIFPQPTFESSLWSTLQSNCIVIKVTMCCVCEVNKSNLIFLYTFRKSLLSQETCLALCCAIPVKSKWHFSYFLVSKRGNDRENILFLVVTVTYWKTKTDLFFMTRLCSHVLVPLLCRNKEGVSCCDRFHQPFFEFLQRGVHFC